MSAKQIEKIHKIKFETVRVRLLNTYIKELEVVAEQYNKMNPGENLKVSDIINNLVSDFIKSRGVII
jgi:hypothetical protein